MTQKIKTSLTTPTGTGLSPCIQGIFCGKKFLNFGLASAGENQKVATKSGDNQVFIFKNTFLGSTRPHVLKRRGGGLVYEI